MLRTVARHKISGAARSPHEPPRLQVEFIEHVHTPRLQVKYLAEAVDIAGLCGKGNVSDHMADVDAIRVHLHIGLDINEFLLFHGVKSSLVERICVKSLDTRFAGENTGKMFGDGS